MGIDSILNWFKLAPEDEDYDDEDTDETEAEEAEVIEDNTESEE